MVNETVLLKLLAGGKINLYSYLDENNKRHFFAEKDAKTEELGYVKYISNAKYFVELPFYIETLKSLTADCDKVKIDKPKFTEASIKTIVEKYNSCFGSTQSFVLAKEKAKLSGGIIAGVRSTSFDYVGPDHTVNKAYSFPGADQGEYNTTTTAVGGIFLDLIPKRESKQLSGGMQLFYQQTGTFSAVLDKPNIYHREYNAKFSYLSAGVNLKRYLLKTRRPAIYIKAGVGYNYLLSQTATAYVNDAIIGTPKHVDFMEFSSSGFNYNAALGLNLNRLFVEVQYQHDNIYSNPGSTASLTGIGLLVGYKVF